MTHIGILGGGQLAQMLLLAAANFTVSTTVLETDTANICKAHATYSIDGSVQDPQAIRKLVESVDITTYEIEHIDIQTLLQLEQEGHRFAPSAKILEIIQNKGMQKDFFAQQALPTAPYVLTQTPQEIEGAVTHFPGDKVVIKSCTGGYDGKGVNIINKDPLDLTQLKKGACVVEQYIPHATELAVMVARDQQGNMACRDVVEMVFNQHNTLNYQLCPARISDEIAQQAKHIAQQAIQAFDGIGIFGVEFFLTQEQELLINEIAPRPHNSQHHTIDTSVTSQFQQLIRILLSMPLGSVTSTSASMMVNLLGPQDHVGAYQLVDAVALAEHPDVSVHLYDKYPSRPNRKLGHVTISGSTPTALIQTYSKLQPLLRLVPRHD